MGRSIWGWFILGFTVKYHHKLVPWEIPWYPREKYPFISESFIVGDDIQMIPHDYIPLNTPLHAHDIPIESHVKSLVIFPFQDIQAARANYRPGCRFLELRGLVGGLRSQFSNCLMYLILVRKKYMTRSNPQCLRGLFYITIYNPNCWGVQISSPNRLEGRLCDGRLCDGLFGSKSREQHWTSPINYSDYMLLYILIIIPLACTLYMVIMLCLYCDSN